MDDLQRLPCLATLPPLGYLLSVLIAWDRDVCKACSEMACIGNHTGDSDQEIKDQRKIFRFSSTTIQSSADHKTCRRMGSVGSINSAGVS